MNRCVQSLVFACLGRSMFGAIPEAVEEQVAGHQDELTLRTTGHSVTLGLRKICSSQNKA